MSLDEVDHGRKPAGNIPGVSVKPEDGVARVLGPGVPGVKGEVVLRTQCYVFHRYRGGGGKIPVAIPGGMVKKAVFEDHDKKPEDRCCEDERTGQNSREPEDPFHLSVSRAMMILWISLVPSYILLTLLSL